MPEAREEHRGMVAFGNSQGCKLGFCILLAFPVLGWVEQQEGTFALAVGDGFIKDRGFQISIGFIRRQAEEVEKICFLQGINALLVAFVSGVIALLELESIASSCSLQNTS